MRRLIAAALLLMPAALLAQDPAESQEPQAEATGSFGFDFTNQYFFRGILQENQGAIFQPWFELSMLMGDGSDDAFGDLALTFGSWNSLHDGPTGSGTPGQGMWYESDFYAGLTASLCDRVSGSVVYSAYHAPNGNWATVQELSMSVTFDDSGMVCPSGLQPTLVYGVETSGSMENNSGDSGSYLQFGIEPSFSPDCCRDCGVTFSVPVTVGFSLGDYYEAPVAGGGSDDSYGFFDIGLTASAPLTFLPARMGAWDGTIGVHWVDLGDNNALRNGDSSQVVVSFGMSTTF